MSSQGHPDSIISGWPFYVERLMRLVMIDNYDSFTFNIVQLFYEFDIEVLVYRHDRVSLGEIDCLSPDWICISPGPKTPAHAGISGEVVRRFGPRIPILGVCLGMQVINEVFGGSTVRSPLPLHGKCSKVSHSGQGIFENLPSPLQAARYHSLQISLNSPDLTVTARADDGVIMGLEHRVMPIWGVQFHPESFMTEYGLEMAANFLSMKKGWKACGPNLKAADRFPRWTRPGDHGLVSA